MPKKSRLAPCIYVLAGTNGAGKSSIAGAMLLAQGTGYFNPDEAAARMRLVNPRLTPATANSLAWREGKRLLERAIEQRWNFAFETTLGGRTIPTLLAGALSAGIQVRIWYAGLSSVEQHIARVRARVAKGGHAIPDARIRERYDSSRVHLIELMPRLTELRVYDNSKEADPDAGATPAPRLLLHMAGGAMVKACELVSTPQWAKPILAVAMKSR